MVTDLKREIVPDDSSLALVDAIPARPAHITSVNEELAGRLLGGSSQQHREAPDEHLWDSFWAEHASSASIFHRILWRIRFLFSRQYAIRLLAELSMVPPPSNPGLPVLEIGCGSATTLSNIARKAAQAKPYALDLSEEAINLALDRNPRFRGVRGNAVALPFGDNRFSLAFSIGLTEHFDRATAHAIVQEHCRVAKEGGRVAVMVPWRSSPYNLLRILFGRHWPFGDEFPFGISELRDFMEEHPLVGVRIHVIYATTLLAIGRKSEAGEGAGGSVAAGQ